MAKKSAYYKEIKKHMLWVLGHPSCFITHNDPVRWARAFTPMIADNVAREDYEAAQAIKDAIIEFLNGFGAELSKDTILNLVRE